MLRTIPAATLAVALAASSSYAVFPSGNPIGTTAPQTSWSIEIEDVLTVPNSAGQAPRMEDLVFGGAPGLGYIVDQRGPIYTFDPTDANPSTTFFFDVYDVVGNENIDFQTGVRGMAFHPDFNTPGTDGYRTFYTSHSRDAFSPGVGGPKSFFSPPGINHESVVGEWRVDAAGDVIASSYREVLRVGQPEDDHNIGQIAFNPTAGPGDADYGNLYVALGDGGGPGNPNNTAQDISTTTPNSGGMGFPHGSMLRIDPIDPDSPGGDPFSIPADNPFVGQANTIQEIWAYGLRNPHKFTWDTVSGKMLISDIGQANVEEVNLGAPGANYGWDVSEGTFEVVNTGTVTDLPAGHPTDSFTYPVAQYDHDLDNNGFIDSLYAIAGGPVYRGDDIPQLRGRYIFGDFSEGNRVWAVGVDELVQREDFTDVENLSGGNLAPYEQIRFTRNGSPTTLLNLIRAESGNFGLTRTDIRLEEGPDGELYVLNKRDGVLRRFSSLTGLIAGDLNEDGFVDALDYTRYRELLGERYDTPDLATWAANYGAGAASTTTSVPEPGAAWLFAAAAFAAAARRR